METHKTPVGSKVVRLVTIVTYETPVGSKVVSYYGDLPDTSGARGWAVLEFQLRTTCCILSSGISTGQGREMIAAAILIALYVTMSRKTHFFQTEFLASTNSPLILHTMVVQVSRLDFPLQRYEPKFSTVSLELHLKKMHFKIFPMYMKH